MNKEEIFRIVSQYENFENYSVDEYMNDKIWVYGNIEFYFNFFENSNNVLDMIFSDCFYHGENLNGDNVFDIDLSFMKKIVPNKTTFEKFIELINKNDINYIKNSFDSDNLEIRFDTGIIVTFVKKYEDELDQNYYISSISLSKI